MQSLVVVREFCATISRFCLWACRMFLSAAFLALGAVMLFVLLRRGDVLAVAEGETAPVVT